MSQRICHLFKILLGIKFEIESGLTGIETPVKARVNKLFKKENMSSSKSSNSITKFTTTKTSGQTSTVARSMLTKSHSVNQIERRA